MSDVNRKPLTVAPIAGLAQPGWSRPVANDRTADRAQEMLDDRPYGQLKWVDGAALFGLLALMALYAARFINFSVEPYKDAAMLMRYAQHLAQGNGITWNSGEKPVDGATDFLLLLLMAAFVKAGLTVETATRAIGSFAHLGTVLLVYVGMRKLHNASIFVALPSAAFLAIGPALSYIAVYFGTPLFGLCATITWGLAIILARRGESRTRALLFALSGLIMGLVRPEGVFLAGFMLAAVIYANGFSASRQTIASFVAVFAALGGAYFLWRWSYFGYPLPNPFYKKGGGTLRKSSLVPTAVEIITLTLPFLWVFFLNLASAKRARASVFALIPIIGFSGIWVLLSDETNYLGRFQYAVLPIVLLSWVPLVQGTYEDLAQGTLPSQRWHAILAGYLPRIAIPLIARAFPAILCGFTLLALVVYQHEQKISNYHDGRYDVALELGSYTNREYTIATTEAGLLPLYSGWRAIDTWGLNDQWIAHNGGITEDYLDRYHPDIVMFHAPFSPLTPTPTTAGDDRWLAMVLTLKAYAERRGYILAAAYGPSIERAHYYYVRADIAESGEIVATLRGQEYRWFSTGNRAVDWAALAAATER